jgi:hypothetical protein
MFGTKRERREGPEKRAKHWAKWMMAKAKWPNWPNTRMALLKKPATEADERMKRSRENWKGNGQKEMPGKWGEHIRIYCTIYNLEENQPK